MTLALSKKDKCLLVGLLGALFLFAAWYFVYTPLQEKTVTMQSENVALKAKADLYQAINANLPKYEAGIDEMKQDITAISNRYPVYISREDEIMFLANMENFYSEDIAVENITMSAVLEVIPEVTQETSSEAVSEAETVAATDTAVQEAVVPEIHMYRQPVNYSFRCTYKGMKDMISYLFNQNSQKGIESMSLAFDSETGNLMGTLDLNQYYMTGIEKPYEALDVPSVPKGVSDVFHTINGSVGVDAVISEETEE